MKISDQSEKRGSEEATKPNTLPELIIKTELIYGVKVFMLLCLTCFKKSVTSDDIRKAIALRYGLEAVQLTTLSVEALLVENVVLDQCARI